MTTTSAVRRLDAVSCLERLTTHPVKVGVLALDHHGMPDLFPMNYSVDRGDLVLRTDAGTKLDALLNGSTVAFAVTKVDPAWHDGWSVVVRGRARLVADPNEAERLQRSLRTWVGGDQPHVFRIEAVTITGRELY